jgi:hypothetical protein
LWLELQEYAKDKLEFKPDSPEFKQILRNNSIKINKIKAG